MTGAVSLLDRSLAVKTLSRVQALSEPMERRARTDLYHYHAESKDIYLARDRIHPLETLRRSPCNIAPVSQRYGVDFAKH